MTQHRENRVLALSGVLKAVFVVVLEDAVALEGGIVAKNDRSSRQQYENIISSDENKKDSLMQKKADGRMRNEEVKSTYVYYFNFTKSLNVFSNCYLHSKREKKKKEK